MIVGFFDDSGKESDTGNRFVVLAGFSALDYSPFQKLHLQWAELLYRHELPGIHMKNILNIAKKRGWDMPTLNAVLGEFIQVIRQSNLVGMGIGVDLEAWRLIRPEITRQLGDSQVFCCSRLVRSIMDRLETLRMQHEEISVTFDRDFEFARRRVRLFEELSRQYPQIAAHVAQVSFADSESFYPLQAADLLAWETRRELFNKARATQSTARWRDLMAALPSGQIQFDVGEFWTEAWFDEEMPKLGFPNWRIEA